MSDLTDPAGLVALAAAAAAVLALGWATWLTMRVRRLRSDQRAVLGDGPAEDLVAHAAGLQQAFLELRDWMEEIAARLDERMGTAEARLDESISYRALVRYDAYGELTGHQSTTIALLDDHRNGVVLSSIAHRESSRLYCKQVTAGRGDVELSPEEAEAVRLALAREETSRTLG